MTQAEKVKQKVQELRELINSDETQGGFGVLVFYCEPIDDDNGNTIGAVAGKGIQIEACLYSALTGTHQANPEIAMSAILRHKENIIRSRKG